MRSRLFTLAAILWIPIVIIIVAVTMYREMVSRGTDPLQISGDMTILVYLALVAVASVFVIAVGWVALFVVYWLVERSRY